MFFNIIRYSKQQMTAWSMINAVKSKKFIQYIEFIPWIRRRSTAWKQMTNLNLLFPGNDLLLLSLKMKDRSLISHYGNPVYVNFKELLLIGNPFDDFWQVIAHNFFC